MERVEKMQGGSDNKEAKAMKIFNIRNVDRFFEAVGRCRGKVEARMPDGGRIDLKASPFCEPLAKMFAGRGGIRELDLDVRDGSDVQVLLGYMLAG